MRKKVFDHGGEERRKQTAESQQEETKPILLSRFVLALREANIGKRSVNQHVTGRRTPLPRRLTRLGYFMLAAELLFPLAGARERGRTDPGSLVFPFGSVPVARDCAPAGLTAAPSLPAVIYESDPRSRSICLGLERRIRSRRRRLRVLLFLCLD